MRLSFTDPVAAVPGVGPRTAAALAEAGVLTVWDLLWYLPRRWEDRCQPTPLVEVRPGEEAVTVWGILTDLRRRRVRGQLWIVEAVLSDGRGSLQVVWFNQPYLATTLKVGQPVWLHGVVRPGRRFHRELSSPEWEVAAAQGHPLHHGRIVPIYTRLGQVTGRRLRTLVMAALRGIEAPGWDPLAGVAPPGEAVLGLVEALAETHFPSAGAEAHQRRELLRRLHGRLTPAQRRLAQYEFLGLAVVLERARQWRSKQRAEQCVVTREVRQRARAALPFRLTGGQKRALGEIVADLQRPVPMGRLLHGDVGTGKTVVAALAALVVAESGFQVAVLAPTELLAQQLFATFASVFRGTGHRLALLVGSMAEGAKAEVRAGLAAGTLPVAVGTHALLQEAVHFPRLGLVIIDEQHRFGVAQRRSLLEKGRAPHLLVMSATPIPRSLALALYGDLEVSTLRELPPGRTPVRTVVVEGRWRQRVLAWVAGRVQRGVQAFWVFPVIGESSEVAVRALLQHAEEVRRGLAGVTVGILHGRLSANERDRVMAAFVRGEVHVLCTTTLVEVGVDVPRASVMVVENAERFGLAQLHQLRGRVGRGGGRAACVLLLGERCTPQARERLRRFAALTDGFAVAEEDLRQRGAGEVTGWRQWGRSEFKVADLWIHRQELELVSALARRWGEEGRLEAHLPFSSGLVKGEVGPA